MGITMKRSALPFAVFAAFAVSACSNMDTTEQRTLSGGAIGAAAGTVITAATGGCIVCGAAIGAGVGAVGGFVYDKLNPEPKRQ